MGEASQQRSKCEPPIQMKCLRFMVQPVTGKSYLDINLSDFCVVDKKDLYILDMNSCI